MIDMHVHFFPEAVFRAIWRYFEQASVGLWSIRYRVFGAQHVETLRGYGIERFTTLVYAHKKGMADKLNDFVMRTAAEFPEAIAFGTLFAGDGEVKSRARRLFEEQRTYGIKLHPFVSGEDLDDPRFFPAYEIMEGLGRILVCHPGSGPNYAQNDGAERIERILQSFPRLNVVIAHCGAVEYAEYQALARSYANVYFDTAMNCVHTHVFERNCPGRGFFQEFQERVLFGTDFPNIPYEYGEQIESIRRLQLPAATETAIFSGNAKRLLATVEASL